MQADSLPAVGQHPKCNVHVMGISTRKDRESNRKKKKQTEFLHINVRHQTKHPGAGGSVQFGSVAQSCPTLCDHMNRSTPNLPVHHHLPEFTQTHVHQVEDAIQPPHPLSSPSPLAPNPSQHQSLFQ